MNRLIACALILSASACASDESTRNHPTTVRAHDDDAAHRHHRERVAEENGIHNDLDDADHADGHRHDRAAVPVEATDVKPVAVANVAPEDANRETTTADGRVVRDDQHPSDGEVTRRIRKAVTDDGRLSTAAKNAKIVTKDGHVTLQGNVPNTGEKDAVDGYARNVAGANNVDNQLTVR